MDGSQEDGFTLCFRYTFCMTLDIPKTLEKTNFQDKLI